MFSITVDVIREVLELNLLGTPTDTQIADLTEQLKSALSTLQPSRSGEYRVRVKTRPINPHITRLAATLCEDAGQRVTLPAR
jgi:hypothetical protein